MKHCEKLNFLADNYFDLFFNTRKSVEIELSNKSLFCCCGALATGLHEMHCTKFKNKVNSETIKRLSYLLPTKSKK
jgi:hypothetical protein